LWTGLGSGRVEIISISVAGTFHVPNAAKSLCQPLTVIMDFPCNLQEMVDTGKFSSVSNFPVLYMRCHFFRREHIKIPFTRFRVCVVISLDPEASGSYVCM
jgi:hypothetical protein